jgi:hypothetical protein
MTPATSSVGWLGCRRLEIRPGRPSVALQRTTTRSFLPAITRSRLLISLATAATISGVSPGLTAAISSPVVRWSRIHSRSCATVQVDTLA